MIKIGADLAIKHGAIVDINGHIHYAYSGHKGMAVTADELYELAQMLCFQTPVNSIVACDWDRTSSEWGGGRNPQVAVLITLLVGFYAALVQCRKGCTVHLVTPALVRDCLGLPRTTSKSQVHEAIKNIVPKHLPMDIEGDNHDAWALSYVLECAKS